MESIELTLELFAGVVLLIGAGYLVGRLLKLDKFSEDQEQRQQFHLRKAEFLSEEPGDLMQDNNF